MPHPLIISYYTPGTAYQELAAKLARSAGRLGLDAVIEPRPSRGTWLANCAQKAEFVRDMRRQVPGPIVWIDADADLRRPLTELQDCGADLAVVRREGWLFWGSLIYFADTPAANRLIASWCEYCTDQPHVWDQVSLGYSWWDRTLAGDLTTLALPSTTSEKRLGKYKPVSVSKHAKLLLKGLVQRWRSEAALLQGQQSRRSRDRQEAGEFGTWDLPAWWRDAAAADRPFQLSERQRGELGLRRQGQSGVDSRRPG